MKKLKNIVNKKTDDLLLNKLSEKILLDKEILNFIKENNLGEDFVDINIDIFYEYYILKNNVSNFNYKPNLQFEDNKLKLSYGETLEYKNILEENKWYNKIKTKYISKSILDANFSKLTVGIEKARLAKDLLEICNKYLSGNKTRGLYIYGKTGIGKTYLMGCVYNYFKIKGENPAIIYFPEFVRKMKSKVIGGEYVSIIDEIREQKILIIDDIGSENITEFVRDEILVPIISYRSSENLLTFFTSNLDLENLGDVLSNTKNTIDETKSMRIIDRIRYLSECRYLDSKNERIL